MIFLDISLEKKDQCSLLHSETSLSNLCSSTQLPINSRVTERVGANCHLFAAYHLAVCSSLASPLQPFKPIKVWGCITTHSLSASSHRCSLVCGKSQTSSRFLTSCPLRIPLICYRSEPLRPRPAPSVCLRGPDNEL